jgi:predicted amidophosphoribosyltransferase
MLQQIVDFIFPPQCGGCDAVGNGACERCLPHGALQRVPLQSLDVVALGVYESGLRQAILALKSGRRDVARAFAERLGDIVSEGEILIPVPTTAARLRERGFDGCELIARSIPQTRVLTGLVQIAGDRQRGRGREARLAARGRFTWRGEPLSGRAVTLLDDVVTTGATLEDCASVLRAAGAQIERAIAIAVAR